MSRETRYNLIFGILISGQPKLGNVFTDKVSFVLFKFEKVNNEIK